MEPDPLKVAIQALVEAMTTDAWNAVRPRFVRLITRNRRRDVEARLDARAQRVRGAPAQQAAEVESLADELRPIIDSEHITPAHFEQFVKSVTMLVDKARPAIAANAVVVQGDQFNFHQPPHDLARAGESATVTASLHATGQSEQADMLRHVTMALKDSAASQRALTGEIVALSRVARESQEEAHTARATVLMATAIVIDLRRRIDDLERERDELLDRLRKETRQGTDVTELQRQLADAHQDVRRFNDLYAQTRQELAEARQQQGAAERLADEAMGRLARYEHAQGTQPDLDDYEQALDNLVDDRQLHQERLNEIEQALRGLSPSPPLAPPALAGLSTARREPDAVDDAGGVAIAPPEYRPYSHRGTSTRPDAGTSGPPATRTARRSIYRAFVAPLAGIALAGLFITFVVYAAIQSIRDDAYYLSDMHMTGSKPAASINYGTCYYTACGPTTEDLTYSIRPARVANTTFQVSDHKERYLNVDLDLENIGRSCGASPRVSYTLASDGHLVAQGTVTTNTTYISDLAVGRHAMLSFTAQLHAPSGCVLALDMSNPTLDAIKGWPGGNL
jgi:hypothetical protein